MNDDLAATVIELRLLTHQPEEMVAWWAALLGGAPRPIGSRMTVVTGMGLQVTIERSQIALDYHPEASGVTAINLTVDDVRTVDRTLKRLARRGSEPQRVTRTAGVMVLWFRDPNGTDVGMRLSAPDTHLTTEARVLPEEMDVKSVLAGISIPTPKPLPLMSSIERNEQTDG